MRPNSCESVELDSASVKIDLKMTFFPWIDFPFSAKEKCKSVYNTFLRHPMILITILRLTSRILIANSNSCSVGFSFK